MIVESVPGKIFSKKQQKERKQLLARYDRLVLFFSKNRKMDSSVFPNPLFVDISRFMKDMERKGRKRGEKRKITGKNYVNVYT